MSNHKFWMVWSPDDSRSPGVRFANLAAATHQAELSARNHPDQEFFVMQAISRSEYVAVRTVQLVDDDSDLPFPGFPRSKP